MQPSIRNIKVLYLVYVSVILLCSGLQTATRGRKPHERERRRFCFTSIQPAALAYQ
jgi:hypothetical protein